MKKLRVLGMMALLFVLSLPALAQGRYIPHNQRGVFNLTGYRSYDDYNYRSYPVNNCYDRDYGYRPQQYQQRRPVVIVLNNNNNRGGNNYRPNYRPRTYYDTNTGRSYYYGNNNNYRRGRR